MSEFTVRSPSAPSRDAVLHLLAFPRELARDGIALEQCRHAGNFAPHDSGCAVCMSRLECEWLFHTDEFSALTQRPVEEILDALRFSTVYVESRITLSGHAPQKCRCTACEWLAAANEMLNSSD
jgi:hypothetical protein